MSSGAEHDASPTADDPIDVADDVDAVVDVDQTWVRSEVDGHPDAINVGGGPAHRPGMRGSRPGRPRRPGRRPPSRRNRRASSLAQFAFLAPKESRDRRDRCPERPGG
jgi:hypothetical protein